MVNSQSIINRPNVIYKVPACRGTSVVLVGSIASVRSNSEQMFGGIKRVSSLDLNTANEPLSTM